MHVIITHDGRFHADEILACVMLQKIYPHATIIRTRDINLIESYITNKQIIAIVDVYDMYDPTLNYYDHHQRGFNTSINGVKCSSAGLIWKHFNKQILHAFDYHSRRDCYIVKMVYQRYIRMIDANDNGIDIHCKVDLEYGVNSVEYDLGLPGCGRYDKQDCNIHMRTLYNIVDDCQSFEEAFNLVKQDFHNFMENIKRRIAKYGNVKRYLENLSRYGQKNVMQKYEKDILITERIGKIDDIVCELEGEYNLDVKYVINNKEYVSLVYAVRVHSNKFVQKCPLHKEWLGLRDKELCEISGIDGCLYVHSSGFMAANKTLEGALQMCYKSMESTK